MGRDKSFELSREELKKQLEQGKSCREIAYIISEAQHVNVTRQAIWQRAKKEKLLHLNVHTQHKEYCKKRLIPVTRINTDLTPNSFVDIVKPTSRRQKGKQTREISKAAFISYCQVESYSEELPDISSLKVELQGKQLSSEIYDKVKQLVKKELRNRNIVLGKTYLVRIPDQTKQQIAVGLTKLVQYFREEEIILVDTELNPKIETEFWIDGKHIRIMNTEEWHAAVNYVEKKHGFKTSIYAKFRAFKSSAYKKLSAKDRALLLKKYLEFCSLNSSYQIVNEQAVKDEIAEIETEKIILTVSSL